MSKTRSLVKAVDKRPNAPPIHRQVETPEKAAEPSKIARSMSAAPPPPHGTPPPARAASMMGSVQGGSALQRARMMQGLQQSMGNARVSRMLATRVQPKLTVGAPNDVYEQEADRVADAVMRMPDSNVSPRETGQSHSAPSRIQRVCPECEKQLEMERQGTIAKASLCPDCEKQLRRQPTAGEDGQAQSNTTNATEFQSLAGSASQELGSQAAAMTVQAKRTMDGTPDVTPAMESYLNHSSGGGQPLSDSVRTFMEPRFDRDLSQVRVHTDSRAAGAAKQLNAQAFTRGQDVYFGEGRYQPASPTGQRLLAHELTHVAQQAQDPSPAVQQKPVNADAEKGGSTDQEQQANESLHNGIAGPLPDGTMIERRGWKLVQYSRGHMEMEVYDEEQGDSRLEIWAREGELYGYYLERPLPSEAASPTSMPTFYIGEPSYQHVIRIVRHPNVQIHKSIVQSTPLPLVVHESEFDEQIPITSDTAAMDFGVFVYSLSSQQTTIALDGSWITISIPEKAPGFLPEDFPSAKFAYYIERGWQGEDGKQKVVHIVATPGVVVETGDVDATLGVDPAFRKALVASGYGRTLVPNMVRIQNPRDVPLQGEVFDADAYLGYERYNDEVGGTTIEVFRGRSGVTFQYGTSSTLLTIRPKDPAVGGRFAYQVVSHPETGTSEIRAVIGHGVVVELAEPAERLSREGWVMLQILELPYPEQVPEQGSHIDVDHYFSLGATYHEPTKIEHLSASEELETLLATTAVDIGIGMIPIVGDIVDIGEFALAMFTGKDRWGREVTTTDKVLMGLGALVGLLPFVGGLGSVARGAGKAGARLAMTIAEFARKTGKSVEHLEVILSRLKGAASPDDLATIRRAETALRSGAEVAADDLKVITRLTHELGRTPMLPIFQVPAGAGTPRLWGRMGDVGEAATEDLSVTGWRRGLSLETQEFLRHHPKVASRYADMPPDVRRILTYCGSLCIIRNIDNVSRQQITRVAEMLKRLGGAEMLGPDIRVKLQIFFHTAGDNLDWAFRVINKVRSVDDLNRQLIQAFRRRAMAPPGAIKVNSDLARVTRGVVSGGTRLPHVTSGREWLRQTEGGVGLIPGQIAAKLRSRTFDTFEDLRRAFWQAVAEDDVLKHDFAPGNLGKMGQGGAPSPRPDQHHGGRHTFELHHITPIEHGGSVYDLDNLVVVSPRTHIYIHDYGYVERKGVRLGSGSLP